MKKTHIVVLAILVIAGLSIVTVNAGWFDKEPEPTPVSVQKTWKANNGKLSYRRSGNFARITHVSVSKANWDDRLQEHYVIVTASFSPYYWEGGLSDVGSTKVFEGETVYINQNAYILEDIDLFKNIATFSYWTTE